MLLALAGCGGGRPADQPDVQRQAQAIQTGSNTSTVTLAGAAAQARIDSAGRYALRLRADPSRYLWAPPEGDGLPITTVSLQPGELIPPGAQFRASTPSNMGMGTFTGCTPLRSESTPLLPYTLPALGAWPATVAALPQARFVMLEGDPWSSLTDVPASLRSLAAAGVGSPTPLCQRPGLSGGTRLYLLNGRHLRLADGRLSFARDDGSTTFDAGASWEVVRLHGAGPGAPFVKLVGLVPGPRLSHGEAAAVLVETDDPEGLIDTIELYDGYYRHRIAAEQPYHVLERLPIGTHRWVARARLRSGETVTSAALDLVIAPAPPPAGYAAPTPSLSTPEVQPGATTSLAAGQALTLLANAGQGADKVARVEFLDGDRVLASSPRLPARWEWVGTPGEHVLSVRLTDVYGNVRSSSAQTWRVQPPPAASPALPGVRLRPLDAGTSAPEGRTQRLAVDIQDPDGRLAQVLYYQGSELIGGSSVAPYAVPWNGAVGQHLLSAVAVDRDGRRSASAPLPFEVTAGEPPAPSTAQHPVFFDGIASVEAPAADSRWPSGQDLTVTLYASGTGGYALDRVELYAIDLARIRADGLGPLEFVGSAVPARESSTVNIVWRKPREGRFALVPRVVSADARGSSRARGAAFFEGSVARLSSLALANAVQLTIGNPITATARLVSPGASIGTALELGTGLVLTADAAGQDGTVASVGSLQFFVNDSPLPTSRWPSADAPGQARWLPQAVGRYLLHVVVTDRASGRAFTSPTVRVDVVPAGSPAPITGTDFRAPRLRLLSPAPGSRFTEGTAVTVEAQALDPDGFLTAFQFASDRGSIRLAQPPYRTVWTASGSSATVWAEATDDRGLTSFTPSVTVAIQPAASNQAPRVRLLTPASASAVPVGSRYTLAADASDSDGRVVKVEFLDNGRVLGSATAAPWQLSGTASWVGSHAIAARATDDRGAVTTSLPVLVQVMPAQ